MIGSEPPADRDRPAAMSIRPTVLALVALVVFAACATAAVEPTAAPEGPLLTITRRGGLCPDGPCGSTVAIERDGRLHEVAPTSNEVGTITQPRIAALAAAIVATDFTALRQNRFTEECPVNFDGQETIYQFATAGGIERIASCETQMNESHPLFLAIRDALAAAGRP
jgi:hypothetical protein